MDVNEPDRFVDDLLDASLKQYQSQELRPGLENRILAGVRAHQQSARRRTWGRMLAASATAGLAVTTIVVSLAHRQSVPARAVALSPAPQAATKQPESAVTPHVALNSRYATHRAPRVRTVTHRPEQFPTPRPVTHQEKLLLLYVRRVRESGMVGGPKTFKKDDDLKIPDLRIAALDPIKPLPESGQAPRN